MTVSITGKSVDEQGNIDPEGDAPNGKLAGAAGPWLGEKDAGGLDIFIENPWTKNENRFSTSWQKVLPDEHFYLVHEACFLGLCNLSV